jgi:hypothetical protein
LQQLRETFVSIGRTSTNAAQPYLAAMASLGAVSDDYGYDSGKSVVLYFLSNAGSWRGLVAKAIKAELKAMLK